MLCKFATEPKLADLFNYATCTINSAVIPLLMSLAVVSFIWGVIQYVINGDDENKKSKGRDFMIWGILALTVMVSIWGLVAILGNTFRINNVIPQNPTSNGTGGSNYYQDLQGGDGDNKV